MMFLLRMLTRKRTHSMDPLQVSMTGVRMGERVLQIGCHDKSLLAGLAAKVGLSGTTAVAITAEQQAKRAEAIGRKVGALIEVKDIKASSVWPFDPATFDMVVVDDTDDSFESFTPPGEILRKGFGSLRAGGRIEIVTPINSQHGKFDFVQLLTDAGFKPVRILADVNGLRFVEGLRPPTFAEATAGRQS
jgi:cyclopropane fatty-acyl-phospholipid synthase-like methyltransferase